MILISIILLITISVPTFYLFALMVASFFPTRSFNLPNDRTKSRFAIVVPAHNESAVIGVSIAHLNALDYPLENFSIHVIADYCDDSTAQIARVAGAIVHERNSGPREGKGAALSWGLPEILRDPDICDAVIIFDADTKVDPEFLQVMDEHLAIGEDVIQGQHIIANPEQGLFPALIWAMFLIDNRFQNHGRSVLGWSAKNMGDSICIRANILRFLGWGKGLTEDYQFRHLLILQGIRIVYDSRAKAYGEAPLTWQRAENQRSRWLYGAYISNRNTGALLVKKWLHTGNSLFMDGAFQALFPSYSTLTLVTVLFLIIYLLINLFIDPVVERWMIDCWVLLTFFFFSYPFIGLLLERAPLRAFFAILSGPYFVLWRTWLALKSRYFNQPTHWIRTEHGVKKSSSSNKK
jgi:cellulose synthase/poly-beta-1,6-N-acetylglucosamine synthase-like glycosyltransferase